MSKRYTSNDIIEKFKLKHGDTYNYEKVQYTSWKENVIIICHEHGEFAKRVDKHIAGQGCQHCALVSRARKRSLGYETFIEKANIIHHEKYKYIEFEYKNNDQIIEIYCNKHNITFNQTIFNHLQGQVSCECCVKEKLFLSNHEFIERAILIHGNTYDYSKVNYKTYNYDPVTITCCKHGDFDILPASHLRGFGCNKCNSSKGEMEICRVLDTFGLSYETEKTFDDCVYNKKLRFDFYIEEENIIIEFDGRQHFQPIDFFGGEEAYELNKIRDSIKNTYCETRGIRLLRIKYDENILDSIQNFIGRK